MPMPRKIKRVNLRDKTMVAVHEAHETKLFEFNSEERADAFIQEARARGYEAIKGKYQADAPPRKKTDFKPWT